MKKQIDSKLPLKIIDLRCSNAWDTDLLYIPKVGVSNIEQVLLWNNRITWKGMQTLSLCKWENLVKLDVDKNQIGSKGVKYLSRMQAPVLKELNLCSNQIEKEGVLHISKAYWPKLETFFLNGNKIGGESIKYLTKIHWKNIKNLNLYNTRLTFMEAKGLTLCDWNLQSLDIAINLLLSNKEEKQLNSIVKRRFRLKI